MGWECYRKSIQKLKNYFHVIIPALPGHDVQNKSDYTSVEEICTQMEDWMQKNDYKNVDILYGFSMGGGLAIRTLTDNRLNIKHAVIDAGITPYKLPYIITRFIAVRDFLMIQVGRMSRFVKELFPDIKFRKIDNMNHGQYCLSQPEKFAEDLIKISSRK